MGTRTVNNKSTVTELHGDSGVGALAEEEQGGFWEEKYKE